MPAVLNPWDWSPHTIDVVTAVGTAGAVIVAVGVTTLSSTWRAIRAWMKAPRLSLQHDPATDVAQDAVGEQGTITSSPALYVRLGVSNAPKRHAAQGVEVLLEKVEPVWPAEGVSMEEWVHATVRHNLGPLGWTHIEPRELVVGPGVRRTVDLGFLPA
jgi:hypothetical protein